MAPGSPGLARARPGSAGLGRDPLGTQPSSADCCEAQARPGLPEIKQDMWNNRRLAHARRTSAARLQADPNSLPGA
eukprot:7582836-Alexandrium_andersonii.AAC.1